MKFLSILLLVFSVLVIGQSFAETKANKKLLFDTLKPVLSENIEQGKLVIRYCPDNLCLLVESASTVELSILYEFTIMYFYYEADFPEFRDKNYLLPTGVNPRKEFESVASALLGQYSSNCCKEERKDGACVLKYLRKEYGIKTYFSRTDEGYTAKEEVKG